MCQMLLIQVETPGHLDSRFSTVVGGESCSKIVLRADGRTMIGKASIDISLQVSRTYFLQHSLKCCYDTVQYLVRNRET